jgi:hypothetical protein
LQRVRVAYGQNHRVVLRHEIQRRLNAADQHERSVELIEQRHHPRRRGRRCHPRSENLRDVARRQTVAKRVSGRHVEKDVQRSARMLEDRSPGSRLIKSAIPLTLVGSAGWRDRKASPSFYRPIYKEAGGKNSPDFRPVLRRLRVRARHASFPV